MICRVNGISLRSKIPTDEKACCFVVETLGQKETFQTKSTVDQVYLRSFTFLSQSMDMYATFLSSSKFISSHEKWPDRSLNPNRLSHNIACLEPCVVDKYPIDIRYPWLIFQCPSSTIHIVKYLLSCHLALHSFLPLCQQLLSMLEHLC